MTLALLVGRCEEEFICDMAETYKVLNWRELPLKTAAILASGLSKDSRCARKLNGTKISSVEYSLLAILDELRNLVWTNVQAHTEKKVPKPKSILMQMLNQDQRPEILSSRTPEEFEERRRKIIEGG